LIAVGREADVFDAGAGKVLRRYRTRPTLDNEVIAMRWAHQHGYPTPELFDVDGSEMLLERVRGSTMLRDLRARPWRSRAYADLLADLHRRLHAIPPPPGLEMRLGAGDSLLHLDLHPENVMVGPDGVSVIDWAGACGGRATVDLASTWVIMATSEIPGGVVMRGVAGRLRRAFVARFLSHFGRDEVAAELPNVARHRLSDPNVTEAERARVVRLVDVRSRST
jgi:aminoglycoside phosphotransferase (APT) family kinase protein